MFNMPHGPSTRGAILPRLYLCLQVLMPKDKNNYHNYSGASNTYLFFGILQSTFRYIHKPSGNNDFKHTFISLRFRQQRSRQACLGLALSMYQAHLLRPMTHTGDKTHQPRLVGVG